MLNLYSFIYFIKSNAVCFNCFFNLRRIYLLYYYFLFSKRHTHNICYLNRIKKPKIINLEESPLLTRCIRRGLSSFDSLQKFEHELLCDVPPPSMSLQCTSTRGGTLVHLASRLDVPNGCAWRSFELMSHKLGSETWLYISGSYSIVLRKSSFRVRVNKRL